MESAWFDQGARIKQRALDAALRLVAYANTLDLLGVAIGCEVIATGWQAANYVGYGLKLLIFAPV